MCETLSLFFYHISLALSSYILVSLIFSISTVLIIVLICVFLFIPPVRKDFVWHCTTRTLRKTVYFDFAHIFTVAFLSYICMSLALISHSLNQLCKLHSHIFTLFLTKKRRLEQIFFFSLPFLALVPFHYREPHTFSLFIHWVLHYFAMVAKQILCLRFHSFVFNRTMRRWTLQSSFLVISLID